MMIHHIKSSINSLLTAGSPQNHACPYINKYSNRELSSRFQQCKLEGQESSFSRWKGSELNYLITFHAMSGLPTVLLRGFVNTQLWPGGTVQRSWKIKYKQAELDCASPGMFYFVTTALFVRCIITWTH